MENDLERARMARLQQQMQAAGWKPDADARQMLTMYLALYARSTRTWGMLKPLNQVEGAHFFVFDWLARDGKTRVLRPAHHHQPGPMSDNEVAGLFHFVLDAHLRNHPGDTPA